jgi:hypothetical protein
MEEMAVEIILEGVKVTDKKSSFDDLMKPGQTAS